MLRMSAVVLFLLLLKNYPIENECINNMFTHTPRIRIWTEARESTFGCFFITQSVLSIMLHVVVRYLYHKHGQICLDSTFFEISIVFFFV